MCVGEAFDDLSNMLSNCRGIRVVGKGSLKKREVGKSDVGKFLSKLERAKRSWTEPSSPTSLILSKFNQNLLTSSGTFDSKVSNFSCPFQLRSELSNSSPNILTSDRTFQVHFFQLLVTPTALSNNTYPIVGNRFQKSLSVSAHADRKFLKRIIFYMQKTKNFKNYNFPKENLKATIFRFIVPVALGFTNISWLDHFSFFAIFSHFKPLECVIMNLIFSVQKCSSNEMSYFHNFE